MAKSYFELIERPCIEKPYIITCIIPKVTEQLVKKRWENKNQNAHKSTCE